MVAAVIPTPYNDSGTAPGGRRPFVLSTPVWQPQDRPRDFLVLTLGCLGLQLIWSCEMSQASPFLLSLGVSKSMMSIVFLAGPLSGLIVQPVVGVLSDRCKSPLGRRRPFIIAGCACSSISVLMLGWSKEIAAVFAEEGTTMHRHLAIACAVVSVYFIDFSVNVIQAMDRSLLVDVVAPAQQPAANAWAGRMFGFGAVFGYWIGGIDLVWWTRGWLGGEQLKVLTIFTSFLLIVTHTVTVLCVRERVLISREDDHMPGGISGAMRALDDVWTTIRTLPRPIQQVFNVQFTGWIGWFPILFFSTTWVAEIYVKTQWGNAGSELAQAPDDVREAATRAGTHAMLWHSMISLATSIILPPLVAPNTPAAPANEAWTGSNSKLDRLKRFLPRVPFAWLSLPLLWALSNTLFSCLLLGTFFAKSVTSASFIVATAGFAWAVTNWAPFAILGDLILRMGSPNSLGMSSSHPSSVMLTEVNPSAARLPRGSADSWDSESHRRLSREGHERDRLRYDDGVPEKGRAPSSLPFQDRDRHSEGEHASANDNAFSLGDSDSPKLQPYSSSAASAASASAQTTTPQTPTTARSFYFDAAASVADSDGHLDRDAMSRSTSSRSFASAASGASASYPRPSSRTSVGSATPTLTASPTTGTGVSSRAGAPRARNDSDASSTIAFPPNHGTVGVDLFGSPTSHHHGGSASVARFGGISEEDGLFAGADAYGADPYTQPYATVRRIDFGAAPHGGNGLEIGTGAGPSASTSTIHLPPQGRVAAFGSRPNGSRDGLGEGSWSGSPSAATGRMYALRDEEEVNGVRSGRSSASEDRQEEVHVLQIRHSDSFDLDEHERLHIQGEGGLGGDEMRWNGPARRTPRISGGGGQEEEWDGPERGEAAQTGGADKTGVILGCHNIYLVLPQFLVTGLSSIIFALFAPHHSVLGHHTPAHHSASNTNGTIDGSSSMDLDDSESLDADRYRSLVVRAVRVVGGAVGEAFAQKLKRQDEGSDDGADADWDPDLPPGSEAGWDALGLIFRVGGVAAACSAYICFRMWRERLQAERRTRSAQRGYRLTG